MGRSAVNASASFLLRLGRWVATAFLLVLASVASAQNWPTQPVKIIAPVPAGGGVDFLSRAIAQKLQEAWNTPVVVENKPGASAAIGTDFVAKSSDGHTLLMGYSVLATNKFLVSKLPYDLERELTPVIHVGYIPLILVTQPNFPANSVKELTALMEQYVSDGRSTPGRAQTNDVPVRQYPDSSRTKAGMPGASWA